MNILIMNFFMILFLLPVNSFLFEISKIKLLVDCQKQSINLSNSKKISDKIFFPFHENNNLLSNNEISDNLNQLIDSQDISKICTDNLEKTDIDFFKVKFMLSELSKNEVSNKISLIKDSIDHNFKDHLAKPLIKVSSSLLPAMDGIAHHVLTLNQNFINFILDSEKVPEEIQKKFVLFSISAAQNGDNMGSSILEFYYQLVDKLL